MTPEVPPPEVSRDDALLHVALAEDTTARLASRPYVIRDREQAISDLHASAHFAPAGLAGPFRLRLGLEAGRLVLDIRDRHDGPLRIHILSLAPFRRLIKDYLMIVDSYGDAVAGGNAARLQAIDMGRRGVHDEAASLLVERFRDRIDIDHETARRLFTLISILFQRS